MFRDSFMGICVVRIRTVVVGAPYWGPLILGHREGYAGLSHAQTPGRIS